MRRHARLLRLTVADPEFANTLLRKHEREHEDAKLIYCSARWRIGRHVLCVLAERKVSFFFLFLFLLVSSLLILHRCQTSPYGLLFA